MNTEIVPAALIISDAAIGREEWRMVALARALFTPEEAVKQLVCRGSPCRTLTPAQHVRVHCGMRVAKLQLMAHTGIVDVAVTTNPLGMLDFT